MPYGAPELLGYRLLERLQQSRGLVPRTVFHKFWSLSDRYAAEELGVTLGVPRYWYKYGELVDEASVDDGFFVESSAPWGGRAYKPVYDTEDDFETTSRERRAVRETVEWVLERFGDKSAQQLEAYQYERYAPNEFVSAYSDLRRALQYTDLDEQTSLSTFAPDGPDDNHGLVADQLDRMVATYPADDPAFEPLFDVFLRWEDTARLLIEQGREFARLEAFLDEFVQAVSEAVLRHQFAVGVDEERVDQWRTNAEASVETFEAAVRDRRTDLLRTRDRSGVLQSVSETYDETVLDGLSEDE